MECHICAASPKSRDVSLRKVNPTGQALRRVVIAYVPPLFLLSAIWVLNIINRPDFLVPLVFNIFLRHTFTNPRDRPLWIFLDAMGQPMHPYKNWPMPLLFGSLWTVCYHIGCLVPIVGLFVSISLWVVAFCLIDLIRVEFDQVRFFLIPKQPSLFVRGIAPSFMFMGFLFSVTSCLKETYPLSVVELVSVAYAMFRVHSAWFRLPALQDSHYEIVRPKRVCVIGAGWAGLYSLQHLLAEGCFEVKCFEKQEKAGGVWNFDEQRVGGISSTTYATSSVAFMHAINLSFPLGTSEFPTAKEWRDFMDLFIERFELKKHITLKTEVVSVRREASSWSVTTRCGNEEILHSFDAVIVSCGPQALPRRRSDLFKEFSGRLMHSGEYKRPDQFAPAEKVSLTHLRIF